MSSNPFSALEAEEEDISESKQPSAPSQSLSHPLSTHVKKRSRQVTVEDVDDIDSDMDQGNNSSSDEQHNIDISGATPMHMATKRSKKKKEAKKRKKLQQSIQQHDNKTQKPMNTAAKSNNHHSSSSSSSAATSTSSHSSTSSAHIDILSDDDGDADADDPHLDAVDSIDNTFDADDSDFDTVGGQSLEMSLLQADKSFVQSDELLKQYNLTQADIAQTTRVLAIILNATTDNKNNNNNVSSSHHSLISSPLYALPIMRPLRSILTPFIQRAVEKETKKLSRGKHRGGGASAATLDQRELDKVARDNTILRKKRLEKLEALTKEDNSNNLLLLRVPDGVAASDETDVNRNYLGSAEQQTLLLTNDTHTKKNDDTSASASTLHTSSSSKTSTGIVNGSSGVFLNVPATCYICKAYYRELHNFYDSLCMSCAILNYKKRHQAVNLEGYVALVTGARVKIGYCILLKLLRMNCFVIATTRFPHDLLARLKAEKDYQSQLKTRVKVYGLDFRDLQTLELFCEMLKSKVQRLDIVINNACQTVRRPPTYYAHLVNNERKALELLPAEDREVVAGHHEFANTRSNGGNLMLTEEPTLPAVRIISSSTQISLSSNKAKTSCIKLTRLFGRSLIFCLSCGPLIPFDVSCLSHFFVLSILLRFCQPIRLTHHLVLLLHPHLLPSLLLRPRHHRLHHHRLLHLLHHLHHHPLHPLACPSRLWKMKMFQFLPLMSLQKLVLALIFPHTVHLLLRLLKIMLLVKVVVKLCVKNKKKVLVLPLLLPLSSHLMIQRQFLPQQLPLLLNHLNFVSSHPIVILPLLNFLLE